MTVLLCHNYYRGRGGEDQSFEDEVIMLREAGVRVITVTRRNDALADGPREGLRVTLNALRDATGRREIEALIDEHQPDIVHCNNLFPQLSGSVYAAAASRGVPVVQALRNYRFLCSAGSFFRDGEICQTCLGAPAAFAGIAHGCYRDSRAASAAVVAVQLMQRATTLSRSASTWFMTPSTFARDLYVTAGLNPERIVVKPNFVHPDLGPAAGTSDRFVYVGRLAEEKGIRTLLEAWRHLSYPLAVYGDGPLRPLVEAAAAELPSVTFHGPTPHRDILEALGAARALVMPSEWFETFGRSVAEAYSRGTPVIASALGALSDLVECGDTGCLVPPADPVALAAAVSEVAEMADGPYRALRDHARSAFQASFSRDVNVKMLLDIYRRARSGDAVAPQPKPVPL